MFDTLTPDERHALNLKLAEWCHQFAGIAHTLAKTSFAVELGSTEDSILWTQSTRYYQIMDELHDLRAEVLAA